MFRIWRWQQESFDINFSYQNKPNNNTRVGVHRLNAYFLYTIFRRRSVIDLQNTDKTNGFQAKYKEDREREREKEINCKELPYSLENIVKI